MTGNSRRITESHLWVVLAVIFGTGLLLTLGSLAYYYVPVISQSYVVSPTSEYSENPQGFLFFTSEDIVPNATSSFDLLIDELNYQQRSAHVKIWVDFFISDSRHGNSTFFVLQVFGNVSNLSITLNGNVPVNYGKKEAILNYDRGATSYVLVEIPSENVTGHVQAQVDFVWRDIFWRRSFYTYEVIVPFNTAFPNFIHDVGLPREAINDSGKLLPDFTSRTLLSVAKPEMAAFSGTMPNPDRVTFYSGKVWYLWDIKAGSDYSKYVSTAVTLDLEIEQFKKEYEQSYAFFALLMGIGLPLVISSVVELLKLSCSRQSEGNSEEKSVEVRASQIVAKRTEREEFVDNSQITAHQKMDKLDSLFLWVASLAGVGFTIFVAYLHVPFVLYIPVFVLITYALAVGYVHGGIFLDSLTERVRGWIYLFFGLSIYVPIGVIRFGEAYFESYFPGFSRVSPYLQIVFGLTIPLAYFYANVKWVLPRLYVTFGIIRGDVTKRILQKTYINSLCFGFAVFILSFSLYDSGIDISSVMQNVAVLVLFLLPIVSEEGKTRILLKLEKFQQCVRLPRIVHRRRLKTSIVLLLTGFGAFVVLWQGIVFVLPLSIFLLFYAMLSPIVAIIILLFYLDVDKIVLDYGASRALAIDEMKELGKLAIALDKNFSLPSNLPDRLSRLYE
jgi:hypothetical protein